MGTNRRRIVWAIVAGCGAVWSAGTVRAGTYTAAQNLGSDGEPKTFTGVLNADNLYGGAWNISTYDPISGDAVKLTNGTYTLTRVFDNGGAGRPPSLGLLDSPTLNSSIVPPVTGDINGDSRVNALDLNVVLAHWGQGVTVGDALLGDLVADGTVNALDLNQILGNWGQIGSPGTLIDGPDDTIWHDGTTSYDVIAKHAIFNSEFGYRSLSDSIDHTLLTSSSVGSAAGPITIGSPSPFAWFINSPEGTFYSDPTLNPQADENGMNLDHMITFKLSGGIYDTKSTWVLWWEDRLINNANQAIGLTDYQDAIYEVSVRNAVVPAPATVYGGLGLLVALGAYRLHTRRTGQGALTAN